jgi:hypothetical protein
LWHPPDQPLKDLESKDVLFVVWVDLENPTGSGILPAGSRRWSCSVLFNYWPPKGTQVSWEAETTNGAEVSLTINNSRYDIAAGRLFLVTARKGQAEVRQLKRDLRGLRADRGAFQKMAKEDADVARFVAAAEENK